jgi:prepilin peptidase CpaA
MLGWILSALFAALALVAAFQDIRTRTIPNLLSLSLAILGLGAVLVIAGGAAALSSLAHFAVVLVAGMVLYALKMWGAGDAKFYAATAIWFPFSEAPRLILAISLSGVVLLAAWYVHGRMRRSADGTASGDLPYGVAIAAGGIIAISMLGLRSGAGYPV